MSNCLIRFKTSIGKHSKPMLGLYLNRQVPWYNASIKTVKLNPPASKASREVAILTERKNPHTPLYGVKEFVCLSVRLLQTLTPIIYPDSPYSQEGMKFAAQISPLLNY